MIRTLAAATCLALSLGACGGGGEPVARAAVATAAPTSTVAPTTSSTTPATTTTSTSSTTTTVPLPRQLTDPVAPPPDARGPEDNPPIGRIAIETIGVDAVLGEGIRLTTLDRGPGHWPGSAMPGEIGNVVVAGHRTSHHADFDRLDKLRAGDEVVFSTDAGTFTYLVNRTEIVTPDALWIINPTDTPIATLFACHPRGSTAKRIVVFLDLST